MLDLTYTQLKSVTEPTTSKSKINLKKKKIVIKLVGARMK